MAGDRSEGEISFRRLNRPGLLLAGDLVDHDCNRPVARHIAGGPEAVHRDVEGDHQRLQGLVEP